LSQTIRYGGVALVAVAAGLLFIWPFASPSTRTGVVVAAVVAYPVQVVAFFMLVRFMREGRRFLLVWVGGTVFRMGVILGAALLVSQSDVLPPAPTLLALAGFFFGLLLLEPLFLRPREAESTEHL
jgi:hypothetical protein